MDYQSEAINRRKEKIENLFRDLDNLHDKNPVDYAEAKLRILSYVNNGHQLPYEEDSSFTAFPYPMPREHISEWRSKHLRRLDRTNRVIKAQIRFLAMQGHSNKSEEKVDLLDKVCKEFRSYLERACIHYAGKKIVSSLHPK